MFQFELLTKRDWALVAAAIVVIALAMASGVFFGLEHLARN